MPVRSRLKGPNRADGWRRRRAFVLVHVLGYDVYGSWMRGRAVACEHCALLAYVLGLVGCRLVLLGLVGFDWGRLF